MSLSVSVTEAANLLGVSRSRVLQLIKSGSLAAQSIGNTWIIDKRDLTRLEGRSPGRPLAPSSAWAIAALLAGQGNWLSPVQRSRARSRIAGAATLADDEHLVSAWRSMLRQRARRKVFSVAEADLSELRVDGRIELSGLSLVSSGLAAADIVEGYVDEAQLPGLVSDYLLVEAADDHGFSGNVVLHVPDQAPPSWRLLVTGPAVQAADLAEHHTPREQAAAAPMLRNEVVSAADRLHG